MALDRIYRLFPQGGTTDGVSVWGSPIESGLASVGESLDIGGVLFAPSSNVTVRMRFRSDLVVGTSRVRDVDDRVWRINETREVGRRRWLDVAMSSYDLPDDVDPDGDEQAGDPDFIPPAGWFLQWRLTGGPNKFAPNGRYVDQLVVAQSERQVVDGDGFSIGDVKFSALIPSPGFAVDVEDPRRTGTDPLANWIEHTLTHGAFGTVTGGWVDATSPDDSGIVGIYVSPEGGQTIAGTTMNAGEVLPGGGLIPYFRAVGATGVLSAGVRINITPGTM